MRGNLFTEYFLGKGIKTTADWKECPVDIERIFKKIEKLLIDFQHRKTPDEPDTEDHLIRPILNILGYYFSRQKSPSKRGRQDIPDFILFSSVENKKVFDEAPRAKKPWHRGVCILEGKRWDRNLDRGDKTDPIDPHIPSNQILRYLSSAEVASNGKILWGILTNGKVWRLYYHRFPSRAEGFLEIDLAEILGDTLFSADVERRHELFKIFYLFFRRRAFTPVSWRPHQTFLEVALEEGKRWEEKVAEDLKNKVFYDVFPDIAKGFLENAKLNGKEVDDTLLNQIYDNTLVFLYRLLFLSYAEDRDLLPVSNSNYYEYSFGKTRQEIAEKIDRKEHFSATATSIWDRLKNLFKIINLGDKTLRIPPYNGGLFDTTKHPFLETFAVSDNWLISAIDKLARDFSSSPPKRINYRDLSVRQLGSIYEGLLEFKLMIADTHLKVKRKRGIEIYEPALSEDEAVIKKGELYLTNDKSERKATGSYYTPDYVVQYIVKNTLEPLIREKLEKFFRWMDTIRSKDRPRVQHGLQEFGIKFDPKKFSKNKAVNDVKPINAARNALLEVKDPAEAILKLKILDPAMGSGHFLVGAVDYLADRVLEILGDTSGRTYFDKIVYGSPLLEKLEQIRDKILNTAAEENYLVNESKLEDKNLIRRIILKRCIYGIDVNLLAVELSKVSLWLHTFTVGAPLSFLDHHLKCGNSLMGSEPKDFEAVLQTKIPLFGTHYAGLMSAVNLLKDLEEITDIDISEIEESNRIYNNVLNQLEPYKKLLDVYVADKFLRPKNKNELKKYNSPVHLVDGMRGNPLDVIKGEANLTREEQIILSKAFKLAQQKCFLHWKLTFPEIWYEGGRQKEHAGFDVVIGNPPYVNILEIPIDEREFLMKSGIYTTTIKRMDLFIPFHERSVKLLSKGGMHSFIVPFPLLTQDYGQQLRMFFLENTVIDRIVDLSKWKIFKDSVVKNIIPIFIKDESDLHYQIKIITQEADPNRTQKIEGPIKLVNASQFKDTYENMFRIDLSPEYYLIQKKIDTMSIKFGKLFAASWGARGVPIEKFHLDSPINKYCKKMIKGENVGAYEIKYSGKWLLYNPKKLYRPSMTVFFENTKIVFQKVTGKCGLIGAYDNNNFYTDDSLICCIPKYYFEGYHEKALRKHKIYVQRNEIELSKKYSLLYILAVMNSIVNGFYFTKFVGYGLNVYPENLEYLPIRQIHFVTPHEERQKLMAKLKVDFENSRFANVLTIVEACLPKNKEHNFISKKEKSDVVHDLLTYLAERMIEYNEIKNIELMSFLQWVEHEIGAKIDNLLNKTTIKNYHQESFDRFLSILKQNKKKLRIDPTHREFQDRIKVEFDKSTTKITPVIQKTVDTNALIDRIVIRLYGLERDESYIYEAFTT